jgi:DNA (cytosine-5)-methyltransferase 1
MLTFYEFFAGGGMARAGLGTNWTCLFANDIDAKKGASYIAHWGKNELLIKNVSSLSVREVPGAADLAWASFPCQDLSLAGGGAGLGGERSGTFWPFWKLICKLSDADRGPKMVVLENVCGALHSHGGRDFAAIGNALASEGYSFGAVVIDAVYFVPQSRPRLFIVGVKGDVPRELRLGTPSGLWHPPMLRTAHSRLDELASEKWVWWNLPQPGLRNVAFSDLIEDAPVDVHWHTTEQTNKLLGLMSPINLEKVKLAQETGKRMVGGVYKRTRIDEYGKKVQRAEARFDDISGCIRTPAGGSSRQTILIVERDNIRSRLLSAREAARLMGLPETYELPENYNEAYHLAGDGVVVPVVRFLSEHILEALLKSPKDAKKRKAA